jgi:hypothetical protein
MPDSALIRRHLVALSTSAPALCQRMVEGLLARLQDPAQQSLDAHARAQSSAAVAWLKGAARPLAMAFAQQWQQNMDQDSRPAPVAAIRPLALLELKDLALVDEDQAERDIEISRVVQAVDLQAEWEWRELMGQVRALQVDPLGDGPALAERHPASPAALGRALGQAVQSLAPSADARAALMRAAAPVMAAELRSFYQQCSDQLRQWGAPDAAYGAIRTAPSPVSPAISTPAVPQAPASPAPAPGGDGVSLTFRSGIDRLPAAAALGTNPPPPSHGADLQRLADLLTHIPPGASLTLRPIDGGAPVHGDHAVVQGLFQQMTHDPRLDRSVKRAIAKLEQAVMQLARTDPTLLTQDDHPTWALINRIAAHAGDHPAAQDPSGTDFLGFVEPVVDRLAQGGGRQDFELALADVQAYIADDEARQDARTAPAREALRRVEQEKELIPLLRQQVDIQLAKAPAISQTLHTFLTGPWTEVLARAMAVQGDESPQTQALVGTVDELLASLQVPANDLERVRIIRGLPQLIERVQEGMGLIDLPQPHRERVLDDLMSTHRRVLFAPSQSAPLAEPPASGPDTDMDWQPSDATLTDRLRDSVSPRTTPDGTPSRTWTGGDTNVGQLPTVPMGLDAVTAAQAVETWMDSLRPGTRCKLFLQGQWTTARMVWRSDNGKFFMFTSPLAGGAHSMTRRALERLRAEGLATELAEASLVQRAISGLKKQLQGG